MSLSKIPFVVASLIGGHIAYTLPGPSAPEYKRKLENVRYSPLATSTKAIIWTLALAELAAIVANTSAARALPISQRILGVLFSAQNTNRLRIVPRAAFGALFALLGGAIRAACYRRMGRHFIADVVIQKHHKLITDGPYSIVRHPGYTGSVMVIGGFCAFHMAPGSFLTESKVLDTNLGRFCAGLIFAVILFPVSFGTYRMRLEDVALRSEFGRDWDEWARKVPYKLIPGVY